MKIITTPMCEDVLKLAGLTDYEVVTPDKIENADLAILLTETDSKIPKLAIKLNTYTQIYESIIKIHKKFNTTINPENIKIVKELIKKNNHKKNLRKNIKVKVYSNFLKETIEDMGFTITMNDYDYVVCPDYLENSVKEELNLITIASHKNVSTNIIKRINERYTILERELCMKQ